MFNLKKVLLLYKKMDFFDLWSGVYSGDTEGIAGNLKKGWKSKSKKKRKEGENGKKILSQYHKSEEQKIPFCVIERQ